MKKPRSGDAFLAQLYFDELYSRMPRAQPAHAVAAAHQLQVAVLDAVLRAHQAGKLAFRADTTVENLSTVISPFIDEMEEERVAAAKAARSTRAPSKPKEPKPAKASASSTTSKETAGSAPATPSGKPRGRPRKSVTAEADGKAAEPAPASDSATKRASSKKPAKK